MLCCNDIPIQVFEIKLFALTGLYTESLADTDKVLCTDKKRWFVPDNGRYFYNLFYDDRSSLYRHLR